MQHNLPLGLVPVREPNLVDDETNRPSRVNLPPPKQ